MAFPIGAQSGSAALLPNAGRCAEGQCSGTLKRRQERHASMQKYRIIIIGAGLGGLAAASALMKAGHRVEIYEQAPALGEIGAGIQLSANAMHALRGIDVADKIMAVGVKPRAYVFRLYDTAEIIQQFSLSDEHEALHGAPYMHLHRADLHEILADRARELDSQVVRLNKRADSFEETGDGATVHFDDGTSASGDLLIGADGLRSMVRRQMFGEAPALYTGDVAWRLLVPTERLPKNLVERVMSLYMGPRGHVVCYYVRSGTLLNFGGFIETDDISEESWTVRYPWENLKADFVGWNSTIQVIIDNCDRDRCFRWSLFSRPTLPNWSQNRVTLLGDSVHPTLPYMAQGAAMAIEDGAVLARALSQESDLPQALQLYQRNRIERTARIVSQSTAYRDLLHLPSTEAIRAAFAKRNEGQDRNRWLYSYNPLTVQLA
jgi:salicylate hydroxylase